MDDIQTQPVVDAGAAQAPAAPADAPAAPAPDAPAPAAPVIPAAPDFSTLPVDAQIASLKAAQDANAEFVRAIAKGLDALGSRVADVEARPATVADVSDVETKVARLLRHIFGE